MPRCFALCLIVAVCACGWDEKLLVTPPPPKTPTRDDKNRGWGVVDPHVHWAAKPGKKVAKTGEQRQTQRGRPGEGAAGGGAGGEKDSEGHEENRMSCILLRHSRVQLLTHIPPLSIYAMMHECARADKRVQSRCALPVGERGT